MTYDLLASGVHVAEVEQLASMVPASWPTAGNERQTTMTIKISDRTLAALFVRIDNTRDGTLGDSGLLDLADELTRNLVCGCANMRELLGEWTAHGYRPTIRELDNEHKALAELYDLFAEFDCLDVVCYRGSR